MLEHPFSGFFKITCFIVFWLSVLCFFMGLYGIGAAGIVIVIISGCIAVILDDKRNS